MNDRFLFRAKRIDNGEWVCGGSIIRFEDHGIESFYMPDAHEKCICTHDEHDNITGFEDCTFYKVDPSTICQCTGLRDKNGKLIYENDVVNCSGILKVSWSEKYSSWCLEAGKWAYQHFFGEACEPCDCEVIGNVFDNQSY